MKRKPIGKANLLKLNIETEKKNIKRLEENLESLQAALKVQEAKDKQKRELVKAENRARYRAKKIVKDYPQYEFSIERCSDTGTYWVCMGQELEDLASKKDHEVSHEHWADDWEGVCDRLEHQLEFCKENFTA